MKHQRCLAAGGDIDRPYLGRIAGLARGYDVLARTQARHIKRSNPRRIASSIDLKLCALRAGVDQRLAGDGDRPRGRSMRPPTAIRAALFDLAYRQARLSFRNRRNWLLDLWRHRSLGHRLLG